MKIDIIRKEDLTDSVRNQVSRLFSQLSPGKKQLDLEQILQSGNNLILAYCQEGQDIIGIASMCNYQVISGNKAWIEDVVVDASARGKGIGRKLMEKLLEVAEKKGITEVLLFTEDHRLPAIKLYKDLGFKPKDSRIFVLKNN